MATPGSYRDRLSDVVPEVTVAAVALGHLALLVAVPDGPTLPVLVGVEAVVGLALVAAEYSSGVSLPAATGVLVPFFALSGLVWGLRWSGTSLGVVALVLIGSVALVAYGLHRYELVTLGLVEDAA